MRRSMSLALLGVTPLALLGCTSLDHASDVATGYVSHQLCSAAFVSHVDPEQYYREAVAPVLAPLDSLSSHAVDPASRSVTSGFASLSRVRAVDRGPLGCLVLHGEPPLPVAVRPDTPGTALLPEIAGPVVVEPEQPALRQALDRAFAENTSPPYRNTKAIVVLRDGQVIAERYAPGYGIDTQLLGWSATKSVTNALIGILVRQGRLSLEGPAPIAAWSDPHDPRRAITVDNLLRMNSGLDIGDSLTAQATTAFDPSAYMVYGVRDMAAFAERAPLKAAPGTQWNYTNGNTLLLSKIVRDLTGGDAAGVLAFARRELFDKLGMHHVTLEFDAVGTPIGSSHMLASARDWARFGQLYLNDGVAGGERILPAGWVDYSAKATPGSERFGYAAGFWTNRGTGGGQSYRIARGIPSDAFMARGANGQYVIVVPSQHLVVARFGPAVTPRDDLDVVARLVADVSAAIPPS